MGSQFVDLDADGRLDLLTATFDGSVWIARGGADGFGPPEHLLDAAGQRIILDYYWDEEKSQHLTDPRAMPGGELRTERLISVLAFDWDGDGDHDLLLGSYENGALYRRMNEGSDAEPKYATVNIAVEAGGVPWRIPSKMTTPKLVDWDGDGDLDLIAGSFESEDKQVGGGVYLSVNEGAPGAPRFGALQVLVEPSPLGWTEATRPDTGLYPDAIDYDGDGDLDLVVGGFSVYTPVPPPLDAEQQARVAELRGIMEETEATQAEFRALQVAAFEKETAGLERGTAEYDAAYAEVMGRYRDDLQACYKKIRTAKAELDKLVPPTQRPSGIWVYERLGRGPAGEPVESL